MINITITTTATAIRVDFGAYAETLNITRGAWSKQYVLSVIRTNGHVSIIVDKEQEWILSHDGNGESLQVDSVDGVTPIDTDTLYDLLKVMV